MSERLKAIVAQIEGKAATAQELLNRLEAHQKPDLLPRDRRQGEREQGRLKVFGFRKRPGRGAM